jgi:uncharacterized protein YgiM (DUF1202 family)
MFIIRLILLSAFLLCSLCRSLAAADNESLSVQVRQGQLRATPSFLGSVTATLAYGEKVKLVEDKGAWKKVTHRKGSGWMHASALTSKTVALQAGKGNVKTEASGSELALAGKGFNSKVEAEFKSRNKHIDYSWVDRMESNAVKPGQMQAFLRQGQVELTGEVAP